MLLKIVLFAYCRGIVSSRGIERACVEQVTFIALSGDSQPHFTTIAAFVSSRGDQIAQIFSQVLVICQRQDLIGREMFAIDGVKLPRNASKQRSGTRAEFTRQAEKMEAAAQAMLQRHREQDQLPVEPDLEAKYTQRVERLQRDAADMRAWLKDHPKDRVGPKGTLRKSNRTDNESAKMATSKGVIQGYTGVAAVDAKCQIIVEAQALGSGNEQEVLIPVIKAMAAVMVDTSLITADAGYHSEDNLAALAALEVDALIADNGMRKRDERFADQDQYKALPDPLHDKAGKAKPRVFQPEDFTYDPIAQTCVCPAGKSLYRHGNQCNIGKYRAFKFQGAQRDCLACPLRKQCLRTPDKTKTRQVAMLTAKQPNIHSERMRLRIDSEAGRARYAGRFAAVEPVFGNLRHNKRLQRFTLRGRTKVDAQWQLFCLVHNIEKLAHHGYAQTRLAA